MRISMLSTLALAAVAAGCGGGGGGAANTNTSAGGGGGPSGSPAVAAFRYAQCMRAHGVSDFPDPQVSSSGGSVRIAIPAPGGGKPGGNSPRLVAAVKACRAILPGPQEFSPAQRRIRQHAFLGFASCMRAHGVSGFPDPTPSGQINREMLAAAHVNIGAPNVQHAAFGCVSSTHGVITPAQVREAIQHFTSGGS